MSRFYISMGSNMGNSLEIFRKAFIRISEIPVFSRKGIVYLQYKTLGENRSAGFPERSASDNL